MQACKINIPKQILNYNFMCPCLYHPCHVFGSTTKPIIQEAPMMDALEKNIEFILMNAKVCKSSVHSQLPLKSLYLGTCINNHRCGQIKLPKKHLSGFPSEPFHCYANQQKITFESFFDHTVNHFPELKDFIKSRVTVQDLEPLCMWIKITLIQSFVFLTNTDSLPSVHSSKRHFFL